MLTTAGTRTEAAPAPAGSLPRGSVADWITTTDHKRIAVLYGVTALFFFLLGGFEALLVRVQLAVPDNRFMSAEAYNQVFTTHAVTMIFLALMPLIAAFFNYLIPLQIGARDVAFPRLNALSYWIYLFGAIYITVPALFGALPNAGWFAYANLTSRTFSPGMNIDVYALGLQILGISSIISSLNFIVTIVNLRAPGMRLLRMPPFTWMALVTSTLMLTAMAVLAVALAQLTFDRFFGSVFFDAAKGGDPLLWQNLFWMFGHPEVYILILPLFGTISEVVPTFSRKPLFGYHVVIFSGILIGWLGWGVWAHHMFAAGLGPIADSFFALGSMMIAIPTGMKIFNWLATMWGGAIRFTAPMLFAIGFLVMFTIGGISGVMHAAAPADLQQTDTYFVVAHIHYVFFGGTVMALFSGLYYWYPKVTGRLMDERLGRWHFGLVFVGANLTFFPMHLLGLYGMPRRTFTYSDGLGFNDMNLLMTAGAFVMASGILVLVVNLVASLKRGRVAGPNPWGAATLEWSVSSPPPAYNFRVIPVVRSRMPLWDRDHGQIEDIARDESAELESEGGHHCCEAPHAPLPSLWPVVVASGIAGSIGSVIFLHADSGMRNLGYLAVVSLLVMIGGIYAWAFEPGHAPAVVHDPDSGRREVLDGLEPAAHLAPGQGKCRS